MPWERGRFLCFTLIITCILLALTLQMEICTYIFTKCLQNYEIKYPCNFWIDQSFLRGSFEDTVFFFTLILKQFPLVCLSFSLSACPKLVVMHVKSVLRYGLAHLSLSLSVRNMFSLSVRYMF
jgi:hypothetical protein